MHVILIDDSEIDNAVNKKLLKLARISDDIEVYTSPRKSLENVKELGITWTSPRLILLDLSMPDIDGMQWLEIFRELPDQVQNKCLIYVLSASIDRKQLDLVDADPSVIALLEKPLDVYLLQQLIKQEA
ncbi:MAG: response regulator [Bacteroidetes bacterium]|jgi:CheY-like chemotaxis protein|nr:response regulator [Bacteroidota bacterium]MDA1382604.1 response regulator [Bacteroidota bacterium]